MIALVSEHARNRDMIEIGAYRTGVNAELDLAVRLKPRIDAFLRQDMAETCTREHSIAMLRAIAGNEVH